MDIVSVTIEVFKFYTTTISNCLQVYTVYMKTAFAYIDIVINLFSVSNIHTFLADPNYPSIIHVRTSTFVRRYVLRMYAPWLGWSNYMYIHIEIYFLAVEVEWC